MAWTRAQETHCGVFLIRVLCVPWLHAGVADCVRPPGAYKLAPVGNCASVKDFTWIESKADCEAAAASLALTDNAAGDATCKHEDAVLSWGKGTATYDTAHATFGQQSFQAKWNIPIAFETGDGEACTGLDLGGVNGGAVVISRGTCAFYVKAINAQRAGADYVIIYNQAGLDDLRSMVCSSVACQEIASKITIPVLFIPYEAGKDLKNSKA